MGAVERLSAREVEIVRQCLAAAVLAAWPAGDDADTQELAVNNVLNNSLGYPHHQGEAWRQYITATPAEVAAVLAPGPSSTPKGEKSL